MSSPTTQTPPKDFDAFLMRIGQINYAWTNTESTLIHLMAGLIPTDTSTATIIHLTLNTTRARLDLVDRLAKRQNCPLPADAIHRILTISKRMKKLSGLRNRLNHCLYAFDQDGGPVRAIQMRIADRKNSLAYGAETVLDEAELAEIDLALRDIQTLNEDIWSVVCDYDMPQ
ncbi:hypothetical protein [Celeribacter sp.]|uniref:hypothetical protein n=1 Tax=Celeribacter sp. TaxID=1890673 RepID=UPI003A926209